MEQRARCGLTAGLAIVGASVVALSPITPATSMPPRLVDAATTLTAAANFVGKSQAELVTIFAQRLGEQFAQAPFIPLVALADLAGGDKYALYAVLKNAVDSPVYVADPLIEAAADTVPESLGGGSNDYPANNGPTGAAGDGVLMQFRNDTILGLRDDISGLFASFVGVDPADPLAQAAARENLAADLALQGVLVSAERTVTGLATAPLGLIPIAQAMVAGDTAALYTAVREYIDAPLWASDPTIEQLARVLPPSLGGGTDGDPTTDDEADGALMHFRNTTLIGARDTARVTVADALDVDVDSTGNPVEAGQPGADLLVANHKVALQSDTVKKPVTSLQAQLKKANEKAAERAQQRQQKIKAGVQQTVKNVKKVVKGLTKNLTPKKATAEKKTTTSDAE